MTVDQFVKTLLKIDLFLFANLLVFVTLMLFAGFQDVWIIYIYAILMLVYMTLILLTLCSKNFSELDPFAKLKRLQQFQTFRTWLMVLTILAVFASTILFVVFAFTPRLFKDYKPEYHTIRIFCFLDDLFILFISINGIYLHRQVRVILTKLDRRRQV